MPATLIGVTLISGFLGAGKTTLVNRILRADHGRRMGVLVNDFGDIDIDSRLIVSRDEDTVTLANGCICCTLRDDVGTALRQLADRDVEHVVVEASGIADPRVLTQTFTLLDRGRKLALDAVVVVVDCAELPGYGPADLSLARDQLSQANVALLNKTDLAEERDMRVVDAEVARFCPRAAIARCQHADVPLSLLLGVGPLIPMPAAEIADHGFTTCSFVSDTPLTLARLRETATDLPRAVFRAKGIVLLRERPDHACVLQIVGQRARIDLGETWGDATPRSEIVFIGRDDLDPQAIQAAFAACTQPPDEPSVMDRAISWLRRYTHPGNAPKV